MTFIPAVYVLASIALASAWIAAEFASKSLWRLAFEWLVAALVWPFLLALVFALLLVTKVGDERLSDGAGRRVAPRSESERTPRVRASATSAAQVIDKLNQRN
jgi:hypothetical protein